MRILILVLSALTCFAQSKQNVVETGVKDARTAMWLFPQRTFAATPTATDGAVYTFTDASSTGVCAGGGSALALCRGNGATWDPIGGGQSTGVTALSTTCASTVNWPVGTANMASITTTGSCNLTISGMGAGKYYTVFVTQGSGGSHTLTLGTGGAGGCAAWKVGGTGAGAVTVSTASGKIDVLAIAYDGTNCFANYRQDFN